MIILTIYKRFLEILFIIDQVNPKLLHSKRKQNLLIMSTKSSVDLRAELAELVKRKAEIAVSIEKM
jgi:hypothetical protein